MVKKWSEFGQNFLSKGGVPLAFTGVGGTVLGASVIAGPAAPIVLMIGGVITVPSLIWTVVAGFQAIPENLKNAIDELGKYKELNQINEMYPLPLKLGFVGRTRAGKSNLLNRFCEVSSEMEAEGQNREGQSTEKTYAYIHSILYEPVGGDLKILAVIDGSGGGSKRRDYQLLDIAKEADILCVVLDHTPQGYDTLKKEYCEIDIDNARLNEHKVFLDTLKEYLEESINEHINNKKKKLECIHFLMNKRNYWKREDEHYLESWFNEIVKDWKDNRRSLSNRISGAIHSNLSSGDINALRKQISNVIKDIEKK